MTIKETVRGAQDILARMAMHLYIDDIRSQARKLAEDGRRIAFLTGARRDYVWPGPPQSLGELCIELTQRWMLTSFQAYHDFGPPYDFSGWVDSFIKHRYGLRDLRRAMYHRASSGPMFAKGAGDRLESRETK